MRVGVGVLALAATACSGLLFMEQSRPCQIAEDCPIGLVCISGGCGKPNDQACGADNLYGTCPQGQVCEGGTCVPDVPGGAIGLCKKAVIVVVGGELGDLTTTP